MMRLKFLHFNDVHSRFEELARIASAVAELRDGNTVVFDGGDNADFCRLEVEGTCGVISSAILNRIGVDARVFGNNEGFSGKKNGRTISESSDCPVVTCNMYDMRGRRLGFLDDAVVIERSGVRILVIGVTADYNTFYELFGVHVNLPEQELKRVLKDYDEIPYDLLVVLSHLGLKHDREIAQKFPDIDVIVGGHSHTALSEPVSENGVVICQAGGFGECLGELIVDYDEERGEVRGFGSRLINGKSYEADPGVLGLIRSYSAVADKNLSRKLYSVDVSLDHSLTEENAMGNFMADALRDMLKTEIGIINSGVLNGGVAKGRVTKRLLHEISPSPLNPTFMEVRGEDLVSALEKSLREEFQLADGGGPGSRTKYLGNLQVSRNVCVLLKEDPECSLAVKDVTVDGVPLQHERWYSVGTSDFLQRGTGYSDLANNRNEWYRPEFLRDVLRLYLRKKSFVRNAFHKRFLANAC